MKILFLGNGWLGRAMQEDCKLKGYFVKTISKETNSDFNFDLELEEKRQEIIDLCFEFDLLVININPKKYLLDFIQKLVSFDSLKINIFFSSSISVYSEDQGIVDEDSEVLGESENAVILRSCEELLKKVAGKSCIIVRWGGLYDEHRRIENYLKNSPTLARPYAFVNLTHKKTCLNFLNFVISQLSLKLIDGAVIFNIVNTNNVERVKYYHSIVEKFDLNDFRKGRQVLSRHRLPEVIFSN